MNPPLVSVIIINLNGKEFLPRCLSSVFRTEYSNFEVIFVDNDSNDDSVEFVRDNFKDNRLSITKNDRNYGVPGGRNIGSQSAKGEYIVFLDNDAEVDSTWLKELVSAFESDTMIAVAQCKLLNMIERNRFDHAGDYLTSLGFLSERSKQDIDRGQFDKIDDILSAKGAATMIRRSVFEDLGRYDDSYFMYLEETDFCLRAWQAGYRVVFVPKAIVWHAFVTPLKDTKTHYSSRIVRYYGSRNFITTLIKNFSVFNLCKFLPIHILSWLFLSILFLFKGKFQDSSCVIRGVFWNLTHLPSIFKKRSYVQKNIRKVNDQAFLGRVMISQGIGFYFKKAFCYINNRPFRA
ncbi:glycosyltransferase family 2 protein [Candidatus Omnitrophota bacterium]